MDQEMRDYREAPEMDVEAAATAARPPRTLDPRCRAILCTAVGVCAVLFAGSWLVTTSVVLDARTLHAAGFGAFFGHAPLLQRVYFAVSYAFEALVTVVAGVASVAVCYRPSKARARVLTVAWVVLVAASLVFLVLLVVANVNAPAHKKSVEAHKDEFEDAFNAFYCDLRATQICLDADEDSTLANMFSTESSSSITLWDRCRPLVVSHEGSLTSRQTDFLLSCNSTQSVDKWCGASIAYGNASSASTWSPSAVNPGKFRSFETEWPSRVHLDSFYLGVVLVCVTALCWMLRAIKSAGCDGFQAVAVHTPSTDKSEPGKPADSVSIELARRS
jgi:hypothetical protein